MTGKQHYQLFLFLAFCLGPLFTIILALVFVVLLLLGVVK